MNSVTAAALVAATSVVIPYAGGASVPSLPGREPVRHACYQALVEEGCNAYLFGIDEPGVTFWGGCPTYTCGTYPDECVHAVDVRGLDFCHCNNGAPGMTCRACIGFDPVSGQANRFDCDKNGCLEECSLSVWNLGNFWPCLCPE